MNTGLIAARYAKALLLAAEDKNESTAIYDAFATTLQSIEANEKFLSVLKNPTLNEKQKRQLLLVAAGSPKSGLYASFITLLLQNKREEYIQRIALCYVDLYLSDTKKCVGKVKSATSLDEKTQEQIVKLLQQHTGRSVELQLSVDPELIGGFVIDLGDERLDASLASQLERVKKTLITSSH